MKLSDLIIARDRLEDEILQRPIIDSEEPIRELTNKLEPFAGAWHKHILKNPSEDQPFIDHLKPFCTEKIRKFPARAKCFDANQIKHAARVLRLATLNSLLQQVAHGAIDLEDETKVAGDTKPAFDKKLAPLSPVVRQ